jgi:hypothetical protein
LVYIEKVQFVVLVVLLLLKKNFFIFLNPKKIL